MRRIATLAGGSALVGAIGVAGWCAARAAVAVIERNPDPFPRDQLAREPEGEQVLILRPDGTVIRAVVAGEGPTVVLANAYGTPLAEWNIVWDKLLDRGHRVISFDQRGHGHSTIGSAGIGSESMAADDAAVLEHFDVHDGVLVGHSTGDVRIAQNRGPPALDVRMRTERYAGCPETARRRTRRRRTPKPPRRRRGSPIGPSPPSAAVAPTAPAA
jgi:pimeloyl-ACP methyl ester carboxylesterase